MLQCFEWYLPSDASLWKKLSRIAPDLAKAGFTSVWLPPAYKCADGIKDTGYAVYDLYDLGEFDQKGSIPTKYGTKDEYLEAVQKLKEQNLYVLADVVLNHRMGADDTEEVLAVQENPKNRNEDMGPAKMISAWTKYTFPGRHNTYSDFQWNWTDFHGVDWDQKTGECSVYKFYGKNWDKLVDTENGNYDYLMGADVDMNNVDVVNELTNWGKWFLQFTNVDGFRLDAVKHIRSDFFPVWLKELREDSKKELFSVGEYWSENIDSILNYLKNTSYCLSLFDVPLHYNLYNASISDGSYDMRTIFDKTLTKLYPDKAVSFVDNHDTQPGQALSSWVSPWFRPLAYALTLLRQQGYPCVFYGDYFGIRHDNINPISTTLDIYLYVRRHLCYGTQTDYFDDPHIIGWTIAGDDEHPNSGMAVILSNQNAGSKQMNVGKKLANSVLYDITGNLKETVYIDPDGNGIFYTKAKSVSVWVKKEIVL